MVMGLFKSLLKLMRGDARQGSVVVAGGGLSKTIAVNQDAKLLVIGDFGRNSTEYGLWTTI